MYTDALEPLLAAEQDMRLKIAMRIALEQGAVFDGSPSQAHLSAADEAIAAWSSDDEDEHDMRAFRPVGPLQELLIDHRMITDRIADLLDRRLS